MGSVNIVKASAGSGKTYRLAYEYILRVIRDPNLYRRILAVTFTNKATEEMKRRIVAQIDALAEGHPCDYLSDLQRDLGFTSEQIRDRALRVRTRILHDYSHFTVLTIDKFFQRILRSFIKELGLDLNFTLELQTESLLEGAADRLVDEISGDERLRAWVMRFVEDRIESGKAWDVRGEIVKLGRELFSEHYKTRREAPLPKEELARLAAETGGRSRAILGEMKLLAGEALQWVAENGLTVADFAYGSSGVMSYFVKMHKGIVEPYGKRVQDALTSPEKWFAKTSPHAATIRALVPRLQERLKELCDSYDQNIRFLKTAALVQENFRSYALLEDLSERIEALCAEQSILPISETNALLGQLIAGNDTPFIYEKAGNTYSHFMIDEFQDTSSGQWENFVPLLDNALAQEADSPVLLVGDVKQSIYRWRGGDWRILGERAAGRFSGARTETLEANYRSEGTVVQFNNILVGRCVELDNELLNGTLEEAREAGLIDAGTRNELADLLAKAYEDHAQQPRRSDNGGYVQVDLLPAREDPEQKPALVERVEELQRRGFSPDQIAILVRRKAEGVAIAGQLLDYKAAHPESPWCYDLVTQEALMIGGAPVSGFVAAVLTLSSNPADAIQRAIYNRFRKFPPEKPLSEEEQTFILSLRLQPLEEAFEELLLHYRLHETPDHIAYLQAMQDQIHTFSTSRVADIPLFLQWWQETGREQSISLPERSRALTVLTIHKSKGLEYEAVILPDCGWEMTPPANRALVWARASEEPFDALGEMPLRWKGDIGQSYFSPQYYRENVLSHVDNLNLFYVAATRAREELHIFLRGTSSAATINRLIRQALPAAGTDGPVNLGTLGGEQITRGEHISYRFGTPVQKQPLPAPEVAPAAYPVSRGDSKLRLRFDSQRYFPEGEEAPQKLTPRGYGMLMHRLFEQIDDHSQIEERLEAWRREGLIAEEEAVPLREQIRRALSDERIASWFDPTWEVVRNEQAIIVPGSPSVRRPDRVLTKGARAVVVDYKFGTAQKNAYTAQLREYMDLLKRMGYRDVSGYLWYVQQNEVQEIA